MYGMNIFIYLLYIANNEVKDMSISVILTVHEITGMKSNRMIKEMRE